jgi:hypothetical protein
VGSFSSSQYICGIKPVLDRLRNALSVCKSLGGKVLLAASTLHGVLGFLWEQTSLEYFSYVHLLAWAPWEDLLWSAGVSVYIVSASLVQNSHFIFIVIFHTPIRKAATENEAGHWFFFCFQIPP